MSKELLISSTSLEARLVILEDDQATEIFIERAKNRGILGNICKGKVTKVLPGMQAAFVDIGLDRDAFLYVADFLEEYEEYQELFGASGEEGLLPFDRQGEQSADDEAPRSRRGRRRGRPSRKKQAVRSQPDSDDRVEEAEATALSPSPSAAGEQQQSRWPAPADGPATSDRPGTAQEVSFPENKPASASGPNEKSHGGSSQLPGESHHLLPDRVETAVEFEPEQPPEEDPPDSEARLRHKPPLQKLAAPRERRQPRQRGSGNDRALIADLLRQGQEILVQVAKEPIGKKGARITSHVALPGRYLVFMPTVEHVGVSRQIVSDKERQRLKNLVLELRGNSNKGFIVRTVGEGAKKKDFQRDMAYLTELWEEVRGKAEKLSAPALVHREPSLTHRVIRDYFSGEFRAIRVDDEQEYERIVNFVNRFNPDLVKRVRLYNKKVPLLDEYGVSADLEKSLQQKVWLKKGGYIVINQTEALVAIDVNTGRFVGSTNSLEDTITKTNLDVVREVVRQIRLRNLGGIIVIDFIDMDEKKNREKVMEALQQELAKDKSPSKILQFNEFGLVAITRKRVRQSLERLLCQPCTYCNGTGMIRSIRTVCYSIHQEVRRMLPHLGEGEEILIRCHPDVGKTLQDGERLVLKEIEELTDKVVSIKTDPVMHIEQFDVVETGSWDGHE